VQQFGELRIGLGKFVEHAAADAMDAPRAGSRPAPFSNVRQMSCVPSVALSRRIGDGCEAFRCANIAMQNAGYRAGKSEEPDGL
jgi:hypothetical protein